VGNEIYRCQEERSWYCLAVGRVSFCGLDSIGSSSEVVKLE